MLFVALPKAPAGTFLRNSSSAWHISKAKGAPEAGIEGAGEIAVAARRFQLRKLRFESSSIFAQPVPFLKLTQDRCCTHRFRPPPLA